MILYEYSPGGKAGARPDRSATVYTKLLGWVKGLEPSTYGTTTRRSSQLSYTHRVLCASRSTIIARNATRCKPQFSRILKRVFRDHFEHFPPVS